VRPGPEVAFRLQEFVGRFFQRNGLWCQPATFPQIPVAPIGRPCAACSAAPGLSSSAWSSAATTYAVEDESEGHIEVVTGGKVLHFDNNLLSIEDVNFESTY
jgi:hypothetical protein